MRRLWAFVAEFLAYEKTCVAYAVFNRWWVAAVNLVSFAGAVALAWLIWRHPEWSAQRQAFAEVVVVCGLPFLVTTIVLSARLALAPFLVYRNSHRQHVAEVGNLKTAHGTELSTVIRERDEARRKLTFGRPEFTPTTLPLGLEHGLAGISYGEQQSPKSPSTCYLQIVATSPHTATRSRFIIAGNLTRRILRLLVAQQRPTSSLPVMGSVLNSPWQSALFM